MITTAMEAPIIKTIFGKSNNDNKAKFCLGKLNHLKLFPVNEEKYLRRQCNTRCDTNE